MECKKAYERLKIEKINKANCDVSTLVNWLLNNRFYNIVVFNRLIEFAPKYFSNLKIEVCYLNHKLNSELENFKFANVLKQRMIESTVNKNFIFNPNEDVIEYHIFKMLAEEINKKIIIRRKFLWKNGSPRFIVCSLKY